MLWPLVVGAIVFFLAAALILAIHVGRKEERRKRNLSVIASARSEAAREDGRDRNLAKQRADIARKLKQASEQSQEKKKDGASLGEMMQQAGIEAPQSRYWIFSAVFAFFVWVVLLLTAWPGIAKAFIVFTAFLGIPRLFLKWKAKRRQKKFLAEFPDALDAMARLLQAGMPMSEAIVMTSREFTGPLKEEMIRVYESQKIGTPIGEAALQMARRVPLTEAHMFATALQIQSETGSSLSEVLYNLSAVIRARFRLRKKVLALSAEAKSSAMIIGALPFLVMTGLYFARPTYIMILFTVPTGKILLVCAGVWMSMGILMMRQMINFRI